MRNNVQTNYFSKVRSYICKDGKMSDSELQMISEHFRIKKYSKRDFILAQGETETSLSFIVEGKVHQYSIIDSKQVTERISLAGSAFCSYISYTMKIPSNQIQQALSDTILVRIKKDRIEALLRVCPDFCQIMLKKIENIHLQREIRAFILQHKSALDRYKLFLKMEPLSTIYQSQVPQKYIASYIGLTPQAFSKAKSSYLSQKSFLNFD